MGPEPDRGRHLAYRAVVFDADDTLFDYRAAEQAAFLTAAGEFALPGDPESLLAAYRRHNGAVWSELERGEIHPSQIPDERFARLLGELGSPGDLVPSLSGRYLELLAGQDQLCPGAVELVRYLAGRVPLGVVTNGLAAVQRPRIARSPLAPLFQVVVVSEEEGVAKPDPGLLLRALSRLGVAPEDALFVGDGVASDMACAARAGVDFCWVNRDGEAVPPGFGPAMVVTWLGELPALLGEGRSGCE